MPEFDLLTEQWIPVIRKDGTRDELNLRALLRDAPQLREIRDPLPTVEFGLYRFLVALVMDIFSLNAVSTLENLLEEGLFDETRVNDYFTEYCDRFDLFHPTHPFLQTAGMPGEGEKPLAGLLHPLPSGTNVAHFHHTHEADFAVCPAAAARLLTTIAPFMTAGGAGLAPSINGAPPWYVLVSRRKSSLFEKLCLNCCVVPLSQVSGNEPPAWRSAKQISAERSTGASLAEALTWRPRRILLTPGVGGRCSLTGVESKVLVQKMKFASGSSCDFSWRDPSVPYKIVDKDSMVVRPQEGKDVWRDTGPLALLREKDYTSRDGKLRFERPALVTQFANLVANDALEKGSELVLSMYGMRTDMKMKIFEWRQETLALPGPLVWQGKFGGDAQRAMEEAERTAYCLKQAIKHAYPREGKGNSNAFETVITEAHRLFWGDLRGDYDALLTKLSGLNPEGDEAAVALTRTQWRKDLWIHGRMALEDAIEDLDSDAEKLKRQVEARQIFSRNFSSIFAPPGKGKAKKQDLPAPAAPALVA